MGLNFRKSLSIGKLIRLNFSKKGVSVSAGVKGARISLGKGGVRETISLPGTGISWTERQAFKKRKNAEQKASLEKKQQAKTNSKIKTLVWVAVVAGAFLLYRSGVFDEPIAKVKQMLSGKGTVMSASESAGSAKDILKEGISGVTNDKENNTESNVQNINEGEESYATKTDAGDGSAIDLSVTTVVTENSGELMSGKTNDKESTVASEVAAEGKAGVSSVQLKDGTVTLFAATLYVASKSGEKFHKPECRHVKSIATKNLVQYSTHEEAILDKEPCSVCNP